MGLSEKVFDRVRNLVVEIALIIRLHLVEESKLLVRMQFVKLCGVDSLNDDPVRDALSSGETTAVILDNVHHVVGIKVVLLLSRKDLVVLLAERDNNTVVQIVQHLRIVATNELLQFLLEVWGGHLL